jgi:hypothetical protein
MNRRPLFLRSRKNSSDGKQPRGFGPCVIPNWPVGWPSGRRLLGGLLPCFVVTAPKENR